MNLNIKNLYINTKKNFRKGDRIVFNADVMDPEEETSRKPRKRVGTILWIGPYYTLVQLKKYCTCISNHEMLTSRSIRRLN